jgi:hypothetical protein
MANEKHQNYNKPDHPHGQAPKGRPEGPPKVDDRKFA